MPLLPPPEISVVRKEEKEAKIRDFVRRDLAARRSGPGTDLPGRYLMIARSLDSPVARALLSTSAEAVASGVHYRVLFLLGEGVARGLETCPSEQIALMDCRLTTDQRLLDAHELLVLGPRAVWIGDCMRRDPAKRDAYEFYSDDALEASQSAARSFERLWRISVPLLLRRIAGELPDAAAIAAEVAPVSGSGPIEAATRH